MRHCRSCAKTGHSHVQIEVTENMLPPSRHQNRQKWTTFRPTAARPSHRSCDLHLHANSTPDKPGVVQKHPPRLKFIDADLENSFPESDGHR